MDELVNTGFHNAPLRNKEISSAFPAKNVHIGPKGRLESYNESGLIEEERLRTTLATSTKSIKRRQETVLDNFAAQPVNSSTLKITPGPTIVKVTDANKVSTISQSFSTETNRPIVIFPDCLTCLPQESAIPAAITGSCATAHWTLIHLSTAYIWAPVIGCSGSQPECCVYEANPISTITALTTDSVGHLATSTFAHHEQPEEYPFPTASGGEAGKEKEILSACPADHHVQVGDGWKGCCPFGFTPTTSMGVQTPCVTPYPHSIEAPPVPESSLPTRGHKPVVQTITDYVFAVQYTLPPPEPTKAPDQNSTGQKVGIAVGSGIAGILAGILIAWLIVWNRRRDQKIEAQKEKKSKLADDEGHNGGLERNKEKEVDYTQLFLQEQVELQRKARQDEEQYHNTPSELLLAHYSTRPSQSHANPQHIHSDPRRSSQTEQNAGQNTWCNLSNDVGFGGTIHPPAPPKPPPHPPHQSAPSTHQSESNPPHIYPVYPPAHLRLNGRQPENDMSPVSSTSPTTESLSWGTSIQPLWNGSSQGSCPQSPASSCHGSLYPATGFSHVSEFCPGHRE